MSFRRLKIAQNLTISVIISNIPSHLNLADPELLKVGKIDILIVHNEKLKSADEKSCESLSVNSNKKYKKGRFIVTISLKGNLYHFGDSKEKAMR